MTKASSARGAAFAVAALGIALFSVMDVYMKSLSLALGAYSAIFWRIGAGILMSAALYLPRRREWPAPATLRLHFQRGAVGAAASFCFFWGLTQMLVAKAVALSFVAPLFTLFLAALLLGERVGRATILASLVALAGVGLILFSQLRADLGAPGLLGAVAVLASAAFYAYNLILMRRQSQVADAIEVAFFHNVMILVCLLPVAPFFLIMPGAAELPLILLTAILTTLSILLLSWAYARAEASYLVTVEYTAFLWAALFGFLVLGEVAGVFTIAGAVLIVGACLFAARRRPPMPLASLDPAV
jgi:S-adenosylmethionine uptake transporter